MAARKIKTTRKPGGKRINVRKPKDSRTEGLTGSRISRRIERRKTFPKTLPGSEMVRKEPDGRGVRYLHRKMP